MKRWLAPLCALALVEPGRAQTLLEHAPVLSSMPVLQQIPVQRQACSSDGHCGWLTFHETRTVGYRVVYLYEGREYTVQLPQDPGPTVTLQTDPRQLGVTGTPPPAVVTVPPPLHMPAPVVIAPALVYGSYYVPWRYPAHVQPSVGIHLHLGGGHRRGPHRHHR